MADGLNSLCKPLEKQILEVTVTKITAKEGINHGRH